MPVPEGLGVGLIRPCGAVQTVHWKLYILAQIWKGSCVCVCVCVCALEPSWSEAQRFLKGKEKSRGSSAVKEIACTHPSPCNSGGGGSPELRTPRTSSWHGDLIPHAALPAAGAAPAPRQPLLQGRRRRVRNDATRACEDLPGNWNLWQKWARCS